jgi:D-lyxose ketol-isomerase
MHFHWNKMEDIINRGGGDIVFHLWNANRENEAELLDTDVEINKDGRKYLVKAGSDIILKPGESLTLYPYYYHEFIIPEDGTNVLIGEVSMCNDDNTDKRFYEPLGRFPTIEEDEPAYRLLCNEYPPAKD